MSRVHTLPSSVHDVPLALKALVGQVVLVPVQVSATSHSPAPARHTAPAFPAACVQVLVPLSHWSIVQGLAAPVQAVPVRCLASAGQVALVPVQVSAASHSPAAARHTAPGFPAGCVHVALVPLHTSVVQGLPSSVQVVPLALKKSVGQAVLEPSQVSATSHSPAAARHAAPAFPAGCVQAGAPAVPSHPAVVQGLPASVQAAPARVTGAAGQVAAR